MPRRLPTPALLALPWLLLSAACAPVVTRAPFPVELLRVAPEPEPPSAPDDAGLAVYLTDLAEWGRGSAAQIRAIAGIVR